MNRSDQPATAKLLSTLAVAAGAIASQTLPAQATVFVATYNAPVGFFHGAVIPAFPVPITSFFGFSAFLISAKSSGTARFLTFRESGVPMRTLSHSSLGVQVATPVPKGTTYSFFKSGGTSAATLAARNASEAFVGAPGSTKPYYDFQFALGSQIYAGWLHGSLVNNSFSSLFFVLKSVGVSDVPGQLLPAGATGVPEPAGLGTLALAALAAGAAATRRYKRAKRAA